MLQQRLANAVAVRFFLPAPALRPYISTYYLTEIALAEGERIEDRLHPEWANIRFSQNHGWLGGIGNAPLAPVPSVVATGPTSYATRFLPGTMRTWGIGLLPLGWARFVGAAADAYVDCFVDGATDPAFAGFTGLNERLFGGSPNAADEAVTINAFMLDKLATRPAAPEEARIAAAHTALLDTTITTVSGFAARLNMSARSLERLSLRVFGFSPKLLLRRQRFLRSLAQFMLDPSLKWISTLDWQYVDQAHFVRDFQRFMGMSPSRYAALDHPILGAAAKARMAAAGQAMQVLHQPAASG